MMNVYGLAATNRWAESRDTELARYVRQEYGPGVGTGFLYAAAAAGASRTRGRRSRTLAEGLRSVTRAFRARLLGKGRAARGTKDRGATDG